jgi:hypothetical protein
MKEESKRSCREGDNSNRDADSNNERKKHFFTAYGEMVCSGIINHFSLAEVLSSVAYVCTLNGVTAFNSVSNVEQKHSDAASSPFHLNFRCRYYCV